MIGIIDGQAPPFIMLGLSWTISLFALRYGIYAAEHPALWHRVTGWLACYFGCSYALTLLLLIRIGARAGLPGGEGEALFWGLDVIIIGLTSFGFSSPWVLTLHTLRYMRENMLTPPDRLPNASVPTPT